MFDRAVVRAAVRAGVGAICATTLVLAAEQQQSQLDLPEPPAPPAASANAPRAFNGAWEYNAEESINAGTGRREQAPESATARSTTARATTRRAPQRTGGASNLDNYSSIYRAMPMATAHLIRQAENFIRDLLEVPESLEIEASPDLVTFTDDLARRRAYPTDGRGYDYLLSASKYEAKTTWEAGQLKREIAGGGGYKIFETYFLSENGDRMFVIVRVKAPSRPGYVAGFNRVYDRADTEGTSAQR